MLSCSRAWKLNKVAAYSQFLGHSVIVRYRVGDILLSASAVFAGDSGRSIFLEQHVELRGAPKYFRWEIPYPYIHHIEIDAVAESLAVSRLAALQSYCEENAAAAGAGEFSAGAPSVPPFSQRHKTA